MAFCTKCGVKIEGGMVCEQCKVSDSGTASPSPMVTGSASIGAFHTVSQPAGATASQPMTPSRRQSYPQEQKPYPQKGQYPAENRSVEQMYGPQSETKKTFDEFTNRVKKGVDRFQQSSVYRYFMKRIADTKAEQEDDNYTYSIALLGTLFGSLVLILLIRGIDIGSSFASFLSRISGKGMSFEDAKYIVEALKTARMSHLFESAMGMLWGVLISLFVPFATMLIVLKIDGTKPMKQVLIAFANRSVLTAVILSFIFVLSLIFRTLSIYTGIPGLLFMAACMLHSVACFSLMVSETKRIREEIRFYVFSAAFSLNLVLAFIVFLMADPFRSVW